MKPKVICHMMSSVDGRLIADRWSQPFNGKEKDHMYQPYFELEEHFNTRAWMIGRKTVQEDFDTGTFDYEKYPPAKEHAIHKGNLQTTKFSIIIDPAGKTLYKKDNLNGASVITILGEQVSEEYLSHLRQMGISYLFAGSKGDDLSTALEILNQEFGINEILLEGGGVINGKFLKAQLIDELSLLIYPGIDGLSGMPSIFEYAGIKNELPAHGQSLELTSVKQLADGIVWLQYTFHNIIISK